MRHPIIKQEYHNGIFYTKAQQQQQKIKSIKQSELQMTNQHHSWGRKH